MNQSQSEFLTLLGYFYLQNGKFEKALIIFRALHELFPDDPYFLKSLSYACLLNGEHVSALQLAEKYLQKASGAEESQVGYLLKSKSMWGLGRKDEAREILNQFLQLREGVNEA